MSPYIKKQNTKRRKSLFRKWHRRIGFTAAIFLINLAVTGILLNHSEGLSLHKQYIQSNWLIKLYGIKAPKEAKCLILKKEKSSICQIGEKIYLNTSPLIESAEEVVGLILLDNLYYLATINELFIYTNQFVLVDKFDQTSNLPVPINAISVFKTNKKSNSNMLLSLTSNKQQWILNQNDLSWYKNENAMQKNLAQFSQVKKTHLSRLQQRYLQTQITQLKFIQDLHSGRLFSFAGKLATDLFGIVLILLAISGFIAWQRRRTEP